MAEDKMFTVGLWPGEPPFAIGHATEEEVEYRDDNLNERGLNRRLYFVGVPNLTVYLPDAPPRASVVICPGGGYRLLSIDMEGYDVARWLVKRGIAAIVLKYRTLPADVQVPGIQIPDSLYRATLADALQALHLVRQQAEPWRLGTAPVGLLGFSAGGNLALRAATTSPELCAELGVRVEPPDFVAGIYPAVTPDILAAVTAQMPPCFLAGTGDDPTTPYTGCLSLYEALQAAGVSTELHLYRRGGHGFGLRPPAGAAADWMPGLATWLQG